LECSKKEEMIRTKISACAARTILFLSIFWIAGQKSDAQFKNYQYSVLNWGLRAGLNTFSSDYNEFYLRDVRLEGSTKNKVGYNLTGFVRINLGRFFMQPELAWNIYKHNLSFTLEGTDDVPYSTPVEMSIRSYAANVNVLVGFNIIKDGPFIFNFLLGPSFKSIYNTDYNIKGRGDFSNNRSYYKYTGVTGFSFNISKIHFSVRYEFNRPDSDIHLNEISGIPESLQGVYIHKNENILNFSFGFIF
jgi:hypothetical protein